MHTPESCVALDCANIAGPFHTCVPPENPLTWEGDQA